NPTCGPVCYRHVGFGPHAASYTKDRRAPPVLWLEVSGPTAKLFFIFGAQLGVVVPFIAKAVRRTGNKRHFGIVGFVVADLGHPQPAIEKRVSVAGNRKEAIEASSTKGSVPALVTIVFRPSEPFSSPPGAEGSPTPPAAKERSGGS